MTADPRLTKHAVNKVKGKPGRISGGYTVGGEYKGGKIYIHLAQTREDMRRTVLGELMHHLWARSKLAHMFSEKTEEAVVHELEGWLLAVLRENPELVQYLMREDT